MKELKYIAVNSSLLVLISLLFETLNEFIFHFPMMGKENSDNLFGFVLLITILGPLIETTIFTLVPLEIFLFFDYEKKAIPIIISSLIFAATHLFNILYFLSAFIAAVILNKYYLTLRFEHKPIYSAFVQICLIHSLSNFIIYIISSIINGF